MLWSNNLDIIKKYYFQKGLTDQFAKDENYLSSAFQEIESIWTKQIKSIDQIKYVMLSEAPLWGKDKSYIYNPESRQTQFFYFNDLSNVTNSIIKNKIDFIQKLNEIGFLVLDISPFALNENDTCINYRSMGLKNYRALLKETLPIFLAPKLDRIKTKANPNIQFFYRYTRVKAAFNDLIGTLLVDKSLVKSMHEIGDISQSGGGIDRKKLKEIMNYKL